MTIEAKIIEDSVGTHGVRLITMQLKYPRLIHSEFMTHRVFSRNASSSRAIPVAKMLHQVRTDPAMPIHWGANQAGMQARAEIQPEANRQYAKSLWQQAGNMAAYFAETLSAMGLHKQVANRLLEPFQYIHTVVTSTEWNNFFALRDHPDADPNIAALAAVMRAAVDASTPTLRMLDEWHLPYVSEEERKLHPPHTCAKLSAARCARVSYVKHDGVASTMDEDLDLFHMLADNNPPHASPLEHQACPAYTADLWSANFRGWLQHRQIYCGEKPFRKVAESYDTHRVVVGDMTLDEG